MSKSNPTVAERVRQSVEARTALIRALQATLSHADKKQIPQEERERLRRRIRELKQRNQNPIDCLGRGRILYAYWRDGGLEWNRRFGW